MSYIPTEVISDILCRLPVKSLLRFRCVCKLWLGLIDSPDFIKMCLNRSIELKSSHKLILNGDSSLYAVSLDSPEVHITDHTLDVRLTDLNHPLKHDDSVPLVLGHCNGLILISTDVVDCGLWNPSTHKYLKLPYFEFKQPQGCILGHYHAGLGYDQTTDDYKVVRIMQACNLNGQEAYAETMVFSLKLGTWKRIKDFPFWISQEVGGIFALGALHWVVASSEGGMGTFNMLVALDLGTEEYELVPLPINLEMASKVNFGSLDGFLCMSCNYHLNRVDIWLMKDRRETESWMKLLSLAQVDIDWSLEDVIPITYSSSGKQVLVEKDHKQLQWYDLEKRSAERIWTLPRPRTFKAFLCLESLVQLNGGGDDGVCKNMGRAEDKQRQNKKRDGFLSMGFDLKL